MDTQVHSDYTTKTSTRPQEVIPVTQSDDYNAVRFEREHKDEAQWSSKLGWLVWDGLRWQQDERCKVMELARRTARNIFHEAADIPSAEGAKAIAKWANVSLSSPRLEGMLHIARGAMSVTPEELDSQDTFLNCQNGVLSMDSGKLFKHDSDLNITKVINAFYGNSECPKWLEFLDKIFNCDAELILFVQKALGYSLSGDTSEQVLFFLYGMGSNGKSTFLETYRNVLGDYALQCDFETFVAGNNRSIRNDIARMRGARFITSIEVEQGKRLAENVVKQLTGGDTVAARFLNHEYFEFKPKAKFWLAANHKPEVRDTTESIWRRIKVIPFTVTIPDSEKIKNYVDILLEESDGILSWAYEGYKLWKAEGLGEPKSVTDATNKYREDMDVIGGFISECCVIKETNYVLYKDLYARYQAWTTFNGKETVGAGTFKDYLSEKGFSTHRYNTGMAWVGIGIAENG